MRKFLKVCHIISRVFIFLCIAAALLLLFLRPADVTIGPAYAAADDSFWRVFALTLSLSAVMFAASDWAYRTLEDNDFLEQLSSSILKPSFERHDLSDKRFHRTSADELDFNAGLRNISDGKERVLQELSWEKKNNKRLQKKVVGNGIVSLIFFLVALLFLLYPIISFFVSGQLLPLPGGEVLAYSSVAAVVLTFIIIFDYTGYQKAFRRLNTVLSIRTRSDEIYEAERTDLIRPAVPTFVPAVPAEKPAAAPAEPPISAQKESEAIHNPVILPEEEPEEQAAKPEEPVPTEVAKLLTEEGVVVTDAKESVFESLAPEEELSEN